MRPHMGPVDIVGPDGMLDSMEAPLKFEEDETWDNAAGGADMPTIDADDMQLSDLMAMLDSRIPGQTRVTSSIDTFL